MGVSSSLCSVDLKNSINPNEEANEYFDAYLDIKNIYKSIKNSKQINLNIFLISTKSIPNFINLINKSKVLEYIDFKTNQFDVFEKNLLKSLRQYNLDKNIEIYYDYNKCKEILKFNLKEENEFILVSNTFIIIIKINKNNINENEVILESDKDKSI